MSTPETISAYFQTQTLTKEYAEAHIEELTKLVNEIPVVRYSEEDVLAESENDRAFHNKWEHSLVVTENNKPVALLIAYERESEGNKQYPVNTLYMSELAVDSNYRQRGVARNLISAFLEKSNARGFLSLDGVLNYSLQTNSADWNSHVLELYQSLGFEIRATKRYPDALDFVLGYTPR